ncbi:hypothetical protein BDV40DRAFT_71539 [Aspergillus tamarii]|uniref:Uncharacterized protein n=1 Tax=Aspergillus tamarii TaxID=41984 RepID=A0A5N6V2W1_ASPTM|nr:hypothetical protein BDV40DRAFT_71539 [Aspergillus tamarii]
MTGVTFRSLFFLSLFFSFFFFLICLMCQGRCLVPLIVRSIDQKYKKAVGVRR